MWSSCEKLHFHLSMPPRGVARFHDSQGKGQAPDPLVEPSGASLSPLHTLALAGQVVLRSFALVSAITPALPMLAFQGTDQTHNEISCHRLDREGSARLTTTFLQPRADVVARQHRHYCFHKSGNIVFDHE